VRCSQTAWLRRSAALLTPRIWPWRHARHLQDSVPRPAQRRRPPLALSRTALPQQHHHFPTNLISFCIQPTARPLAQLYLVGTRGRALASWADHSTLVLCSADMRSGDARTLKPIDQDVCMLCAVLLVWFSAGLRLRYQAPFLGAASPLWRRKACQFFCSFPATIRLL